MSTSYTKPQEKSNVRKRYLFPRSISECSFNAVQKGLHKGKRVQWRLIQDWPVIVGTYLSLNTRPVKITFPTGKKGNGTLLLAVHGGFATEVQHMEPVLLEKINTYFGYQAVQRLRIQSEYT